MKNKASKVNQFLLQQQLPDDIRVAGGSSTLPSTTNKSNSNATTTSNSGGNNAQSASAGISSLPVTSATRVVSAIDHVTQLVLETCRCTHLQEYLPHILDLELCRSVHHPRGWVMTNPVHSLHLASSQLENSTPTSMHMKQPPILYGEEQQRTNALQTEGIVQYWCPLDGYSAVIHDDTAVDKMEHLPTLHSIHPHQQQQQHHYQQHKAPSPKKRQQIASPVAKAKAKASAAATVAAIPGPPPSSVKPCTTLSTAHAVPSTLTSSTLKDTIGDKTDKPPTQTTVTAPVQTPVSSGSAVRTSALPPSKISTTATVDSPSKPSSAQEGNNEDDDKAPASKEMLTVEPSSAADTIKSVMSISSENPVSEGGNDRPVANSIKEEEKNEQAKAPDAAAKKDNEYQHENKEMEQSSDDVKDTAMNNDKVESFGSKKETEGTSTGNNAIEAIADTVEGDASEDKKETAIIETVPAQRGEPEENNAGEEDNDDGSRVQLEKNKSNNAEPSVDAKSQGTETKETAEVSKQEGGKETNDKVEMPQEAVVEPVVSSSVVLERDPSISKTGSVNNLKEKVEADEERPTTSEAETSEYTGREEANAGESSGSSSAITPSLSRSVSSIPDHSVSTSEVTPNVPSGTPRPMLATSAPLKSASGAVPSERPTTVGSSADEKQQSSISPSPLFEPETDPYIEHLRLEEDRIRLIRRSLSLKRTRKSVEPKEGSTKKKRKRDTDIYKNDGIPGWRASAPKDLNPEQEQEWLEASHQANETVERWMNQFRVCQESFWMQKKRHENESSKTHRRSFYLEPDQITEKPCCQWCVLKSANSSNRPSTKKPKIEPRNFSGDELMQCLECSFIGCSPPSLAPDTRQHILQHLLISGHKFAVSCGEKARVFCFKCGDFIYHEVFEQEKIRIACCQRLPYMAWKEHAILRSFDAFQFLKTQDHGIVWRGLIATYPPTVPREHFCATQLALRRQALFEGRSEEKWLMPKPNALNFAASQRLKSEAQKCKIVAPVGIYNHGNTCYMSAILQCLVFCKPLQQYFLQDIGHNHKSCELYRREEDARRVIVKAKAPSSKSKKNSVSSIAKNNATKVEPQTCLACEMDCLFLSYFGSTVGKDVLFCVEEASRNLLLESPNDDSPEIFCEEILTKGKGDPLIISQLLTSAWKSGKMDHLAGYDQRDAHEFLNAFLELLGKHIVKFRERIYATLTSVDDENAVIPKPEKKDVDIVEQLFQGSLRSVLLCEACGVKRVQHEPFVNISLSLSEEVERMQRGKGIRLLDISVQTCLEHFVLPEKLGDLVYCSSCAKKTETKKQHTFAKLPKVLCLHLKRFDAAHNRKIENFVSFPAHGLNMGSLLSHWCEVTRLESSSYKPEEMPTAEPKILYDLFGTVNHIGNMQSGHYVANVKVDDTWYHCNDQHISCATEESVLKADGAYVLFYVRR